MDPGLCTPVATIIRFSKIPRVPAYNPSFVSISKGEPVLINFHLPEPVRTHVIGLLGLAEQDPRAGFVEHVEFELGRYVPRENEDRGPQYIQLCGAGL